MKNILKDLILFAIGGCLYVMIELIYRGRSHWSMFLLGGICFLALGHINYYLSWNTPLLLQMLTGMGIVTLLELLTGWIVNIRLGWNIWDYSRMPFNFHGQICLTASVEWYFLSGLGIYLDDWLRWKLFGEEKPYYRIL